jgi:hypothetical protein
MRRIRVKVPDKRGVTKLWLKRQHGFRNLTNRKFDEKIRAGPELRLPIFLFFTWPL